MGTKFKFTVDTKLKILANFPWASRTNWFWIRDSKIGSRLDVRGWVPMGAWPGQGQTVGPKYAQVWQSSPKVGKVWSKLEFVSFLFDELGDFQYI